MMLKKIIIRILIFAGILVVFNAIYSKFFYEKDVQKYSSIVELIQDLPENSQIVYFGESSNLTVRKDDVDKRKISQFIGDYYPEIVTSDVTKSAAHAGVYKTLLKQIPEENKIETVIMTLNLRSFNAQWIYSSLETSLQKSLVLLKDNPPLVNRFLLSFKAYDIKSDQERQRQFSRKWKKDTFHLPYEFPYENVSEWNRAMSRRGIKGENGKRDQDLTALACHYIKGYGFQIDTLSNPRIKDFDEIVNYAQQQGWQLVFNLMAENIEKADLLVGNDLTSMMYENAKLLNDYYSRKGVIVVNNLDVVEDEQFIDQNWTTEHYAEKGRKKIARNVALSLKASYSDKFVDIKGLSRNYFAYNFDSPQSLINSKNVNSEESYSGKRSIKIDENTKFGLNFQIGTSNLDLEDPKEVSIDFKVLPLKISKEFKIVFQADGNDLKIWEAKSVLAKTKNMPNWQAYETTFPIDQSLLKADLIKIYLLNTNKDIAYVDDFKIEFR